MILINLGILAKRFNFRSEYSQPPGYGDNPSFRCWYHIMKEPYGGEWEAYTKKGINEVCTHFGGVIETYIMIHKSYI